MPRSDAMRQPQRQLGGRVVVDAARAGEQDARRASARATPSYPAVCSCTTRSRGRASRRPGSSARPRRSRAPPARRRPAAAGRRPARRPARRRRPARPRRRAPAIGSSGDDHETSRGSSGDRSARSPLARTRPAALGVGPGELAGRQRDPRLGVELDDGRRRTPGMAHARDRLHGGVRRDPDLDRGTRARARPAPPGSASPAAGSARDCAASRERVHAPRRATTGRSRAGTTPSNHWSFASSGSGWTIE